MKSKHTSTGSHSKTEDPSDTFTTPPTIDIMKSFSVGLAAVAATILAPSAFAYDQAERDAANEMVAGYGFPPLAAFDKMTPKMLTTVLRNYVGVTNDDAFEYLTSHDLEVIYATVSALNNCEMCLSFHAMALGGAGMDKSDVDALVAGGLPSGESDRAMAIAAKYAMAHNGVMLPREKRHLARLGFDSEEKILEVVYACGFMTANNMAYVHMIGNGLELEPMLQDVGPFKDTVYAKEGDGEL